MHDKYRNKYRVAKVTNRLRAQIALEAARRIYPTIVPARRGTGRGAGSTRSGANELYVAKRKAAAVLGHAPVRPGDLPSDDEVREQLVSPLERGATGPDASSDEGEPGRGGRSPSRAMADHLDRFAIYRMRLVPLESIKQNPPVPPGGGCASITASRCSSWPATPGRTMRNSCWPPCCTMWARASTPPPTSRPAWSRSAAAVSERTLWLIEAPHGPPGPSATDASRSRTRREIEASEYLDDLKLLRDLDDAGRVPGQPVETLDEALAYIHGLEEFERD